MIKFKKFTLENGLRVVLHQDESTPMVTVNVLYDVGSRDEDSEKTGFAHLFEHLMFGGTPKVPNFDSIVQKAAGSNNAFTSSDLTNYFITLPAINLEVALALEADRMGGLLFSPESLEVQRKVVIEEFKQRYLNQPYGDVWLELSPMAFKNHPYQWQTIGKNIRHIEEATLNDVKAFFAKHYAPQNAILSIAGNIDLQDSKRLVNKWFGKINGGDPYKRNLTKERLQTQKRVKILDRKVPQNAIYKAWHIPGRSDDDYYAGKLLSDILGHGLSSRLHENLVHKERLFTQIGAGLNQTLDPGLFIINGMISEGVDFEKAEKAIDREIEKIKKNAISESEFEKLQNKVESVNYFGQISTFNKAFGLAYFELLGDAGQINNEMNRYREVKPEKLTDFAAKFLNEENSSVLYVQSKKQKA